MDTGSSLGLKRLIHCSAVRVVGLMVLASISLTSAARAEQVFTLRNGMVIRGLAREIHSIDANAFTVGAGREVKSFPVLLIDDGLRRTFIHRTGMLAGQPSDVADIGRTIEFKHLLPRITKDVSSIGEILAISPFNEYGRRRVRLRGPDGKSVTIVQGITELNDRYAKVEALKMKPYLDWDMRVATSSLSSDTLKAIFNRRLDQDDLDDRLEVVRFFTDTDRYAEAHEALKEIIRDFPEAEQFKAQLVALTERQAEQLLEEAELRSEAGQYRLSRQILENFPVAEIGRITRLKVQDALAELATNRDQASASIAQLRRLVDQLDPAVAEGLDAIVAEIAAGLSTSTLSRLSDFIRLGTQDSMPVENRVALAVSGWLMGNGAGEQNLKVAVSLIRVRDLVAEYLATSNEARRAAILEELRDLEGAEPEYIARMLPRLAPPVEFPEGSEHPEIPGFFRLGAADDAEADDRQPSPSYVIQLPPEYDPLRDYPCVVALHPLRGTATQQVDWWAGPFDEQIGARMGHATRNGFIVVAPDWARPGQSEYQYSPQTHARVLRALRDAMRRTAIDADRIFIAGHGDGGTAAWDIAISHPDIWAGFIPISPRPAKTIVHYNSNSEYVPSYLLMGELDNAPLKHIGAILNDYINVRTDAMVVLYRGRGHEFFYEEIPRLFEWMKLPAHDRRETPRDLEAATMRVSDNFFWWLELDQLKPLVSINPLLWEEAGRLKAGGISASVQAGNVIRVSRVPADGFTVWLYPEMGIDLSQPVTIRYHGRPIYFDYDGKLDVMLEDARTRADRKRPFWAKLTVP